MKQLILNLKESLGDCKRMERSNCRFKSSYEIVSHRKFFVFDDTKNGTEPIRATINHGDHQLIVWNKGRAEICVVKVDKCLIIDNFRKKCDCILFSNDKFFFVEISEAGNRNAKRNDAVLQIESTFQILKEKNVDLSSHHTKGVICFKSDRHKPVRASFNSMRDLFQEKYNIDLQETANLYF